MWAKMKRTLAKAGVASPGRRRCYIMMVRLSDTAMAKVLCLYSKVRQEGKLPGSWMQAVVAPIWKPGENSTSSSSYRPIAFTSHVWKHMERMVTERLIYFRESRELMSPD
jgi:hypothetical protein